MKKVVYLAPIFLLSFLGKGALANQVEHVSKLDEALKEEAIAESNIAAQNTTVEQTQANPKISTNLLNTKRDNNSVADINTYTASKIDAQKTSSVVINNPANNKVHVHYIDANGNAVDNSSHDDNYDYDIDVNKTGQGSYNVPNGYTLNNPDGKYTISSGALNGTNLKGNTWTVPAQYQTKNVLSTGDAAADEFLRNHNSLQKDYALEVGHTAGDNDNEDSSSDLHPSATVDIYSDYHDMYSGSSDNSWIKKDNVSWYYNSSSNGIEPASSSDAALCERLSNEVSLKGLDLYYWTVDYRDMKVQTTPAYDEQHLPVAFVDSNNNVVGMIQNYTGKVGTTQNVSLTVPTGYKLADGASLPTSVTFQNNTDPLLVDVVPSGEKQSISTDSMRVHFVDQSTGKAVGGDYTISINDNDSYYYQTPEGYAADHNGYRTSVSTSTEYTGLSAINMTYPDDSSISLSMSSNAIKQMYDYFGNDADVAIGPNAGSGSQGATTVAVYDFDNPSNDKRVVIDPDDNISEWQRELYKTVSYSNSQFSKGVVWLLSPKTTQVTTSRRFTDNYHTISGNTVTVPVHKTNSFSFADNSGNVKSYSGNTVNVILEHQTKRIDPNNSSLNLDANNQLHLINTNQEQPKQSTTNFKVGYLLDLVTNNKIIDTNNAQALNNTKIFTVSPSLPIGYNALNTKLLTLNL